MKSVWVTLEPEAVDANLITERSVNIRVIASQGFPEVRIQVS